MLDNNHFQDRTRNRWMILVWIVGLSLLLAACDSRQKTYTVGIVIYTPVFVTAFEGFKEGMANLGYVEGENVTYIFNGILEADPQVIDDEIEKWFGMGAISIILEEIAGYSNATDFGWYNADTYLPSDTHTYGQIFEGPVSPGDSLATVSITFDNPTNFGFYIDPNGVSNDRMYTEHDLNSHDDYQVTIWQINDSSTDYILGWEDLDLNGSTGGDRDYQDMIISIKITPVPEPTTMFLLGTGLVSLIGTRRKSKKS